MKSEVVLLNCNHLDEVLRIGEAAFPTKWSRQDFAYFLAHTSALCLGTQTEDGKILAYLIGLLVQGELDIISIATELENRRQGLAEALLRRAQWDPKVTQITLEVDTANAPAIELYRKLGFQTTGTRKGYYQQKQDAYRMIWRDENSKP
jgi:[ribosomal protein S18]-alanine N-acetyltransferase